MYCKKIFIFFVFFLLIGCGFSPVHKNILTLKYKVEIQNIKGDETLNRFIKNELSKFRNQSNESKLINVYIDTNYTKRILAKNISGVATEYEININVNYTIDLMKQKKDYNFNQKLIIKNFENAFDQRNYENSNLKNFANSFSKKLILEASKLNDN